MDLVNSLTCDNASSPDATKRIFAVYEMKHLRDVFERYSAPPRKSSVSHGAGNRLDDDVRRAVIGVGSPK